MENVKPKEPVKVRVKDIKNGNKSVYLDVYFNGVRKYEFLKLYLVPETDAQAKRMNEETLRLATAIKAKRILELQNSAHGFRSSGYMNADFIRYMVKRAYASTECKNGNRPHSVFCAKLMRLYAKRQEVPFKMVTPEFLEGFVKYLQRYRMKTGKRFKPNTVKVLFTMVSTTLNDAERRGVIMDNPIRRMPKEVLPKAEKPQTCYLTESEVVSIWNTETKFEYTKKIFLFGCFTGLRYSDIVSLKWGNIRENEGRLYINIKQQKTKEMLYIPLSASAVKLLPLKRQKDSFLVFGKEIEYRQVMRNIKRVAKEAGIARNITFHTSRHTFATLLVTKDVDLYTVSKMLGHTNITTTQRYADVINKKKDEAVSRLPDIILE